jgi:hypothetical protein
MKDAERKKKLEMYKKEQQVMSALMAELGTRIAYKSQSIALNSSRSYDGS